MSTPAFIGKKNEDGTVTGIFVNCDGYPDYMLKLLKENYTDPAKVDKLIALGDCSSIDKEVDIPEGVKHTYDEPVDGITVAYHRDRGEDWETVEPMTSENEAAFVKRAGSDYWYLFKGGKWKASKKK